MDRLLTTPPQESEIRALHVGDEVYLTGRIFAMFYPWHFMKAISMAKAGESLPMNLENSVIFHCPASYRKQANKYELKFIGVTTSSKLNKYTPELIKLFKVRCIIGKGGMDRATLEAAEQYGCVYLAMPGGCSALYTQAVSAVVEEYWLQPNWAENVLELSVNKLGPLLVAMDTHGESIYV